MSKVRKNKITLITVVLALFLVSADFVFSNSQIPLQESEINLEVSPHNPEPYEKVQIRLSSYATDLNRATITWQDQTGVVLSGIGKTTYSFNAPGPNITTRLSISISPPTGRSIVKTIHITPSDIDIFWESENGHTPPFYKGKSLPVTNGRVKVVAIPNIEKDRGFSFVWKNGDKVEIDRSGHNKNSFIFKNSMFDESNIITVTASSVDGDYVGQKSTEIMMFSPEIIFYKKNPSLGVDYNNALSGQIKTPEELTIVSEAYHFPLEEDPHRFMYTWRINDKLVDTPEKKEEITIRPTAKSGYATISLEISRLNEMFQKSFTELILNF